MRTPNVYSHVVDVGGIDFLIDSTANHIKKSRYFDTLLNDPDLAQMTDDILIDRDPTHFQLITNEAVLQKCLQGWFDLLRELRGPIWRELNYYGFGPLCSDAQLLHSSSSHAATTIWQGVCNSLNEEMLAVNGFTCTIRSGSSGGIQYHAYHWVEGHGSRSSWPRSGSDNSDESNVPDEVVIPIIANSLTCSDWDLEFDIDAYGNTHLDGDDDMSMYAREFAPCIENVLTCFLESIPGVLVSITENFYSSNTLAVTVTARPGPHPTFGKDIDPHRPIEDIDK